MKKYKIKKGHHRPFLIIPKPLFKNKVSGDFFFNNSCWWWHNDPNKDGDWSKILGFMLGFNIHGESYRFGIRPTEDYKIEFCPYFYQNGKRIKTNARFETYQNTVVSLSIKIISGYVYWFTNGEVLYKRKLKNDNWLKFTTDIYIGGGIPNGKDWTAPHDIYIKKY